MFVLLLCAILSEYMQPGVITQATTSLFARTDRTYKDSPTNFIGQTLITFFRVGTLAMALCLCICTDEQFRFVPFLTICGIIVAMLVLKMCCNWLLDYTFMLSRRFSPVYEHYGNIFTIAICALYPCLLVLLRIGNPTVSLWVLGIIALLFFGMWTYRTIRIYAVSPMSIIYLIIYLCTLELLPFGAVYYISSQTLSL